MLENLFVMDPMDTVAVDKDTTFVFQMEAQERGHRNYHCLISDLSVSDGRPMAVCRPIEVRAIQGDHYTLGPKETRPLDSFSAVFMRKDPPFDMRYVVATYILERVPPTTLVLNRPQALRDANEKLYSLRFGDVIPKTLVSASHEEIRAFVEQLGGTGVLKPLYGAGGEGIFLLSSGDQNFNVIVEQATSHGQHWVEVQEYLPEIRSTGDKRIVLLEGEVLGAIARIPPAGDLRGNMHVGATAEAVELTARDREIVDRVAPTLRDDGLYFVGLDVIGDYLTEVNVTSPTGIQEVNALQGVKLEANVIDFVEREVGARRS